MFILKSDGDKMRRRNISNEHKYFMGGVTRGGTREGHKVRFFCEKSYDFVTTPTCGCLVEPLRIEILFSIFMS